MEVVEGPALVEILRAGPLDVGLAIDYARQLTSGLAAAHAEGVIHRDLKTENVMVLPSGTGRTGDRSGDRFDGDRIKILDFGLARHRRLEEKGEAGKVDPEDEESFTLTGRVVGTPRVMSPEQVLRLPVDERAYLFSLGVLLYELLTGRSSFRALAELDTLRRELTHEQPPARRLNPRVPERLSDLVDRLLAKEPYDRPEDAVAVAAELARIAAASPLHGITGRSPEAAVQTVVASSLIGVEEMTSDGDPAVAGVLGRHRRRLAKLLAEHGGREIAGEGEHHRGKRRHGKRLLLFARTRDAVSFALAYHRALGHLAAPAGGSSGGSTLAARVGIHLGEVF